MQLHFSKMHGIGNDFVVLDCRQQAFALQPEQIRALGDRHTGVGFDQLLSIEPARDPACAFYYGIWNADGSSSGQCGNGVRCVAAWLHRAGALAIGEPVLIESPSGPVSVTLLGPHKVTVDMGEPVFEPARVPLAAAARADRYQIVAGQRTIEFGAVSMGNPHAVVSVSDLADPALEQLGPLLTSHPRFAERVNAGFVLQLDRGHLRLRVHERGAGWTRACGSGACAAMAVLHQRGEVDDAVVVELPGGSLRIDWAGAGHRLRMTGPAAFVFEGEWPVPAIGG
ncbi:diaminopimelate epimerase [Rhodanobacter ginsengiterrae]|uniref:diaminopimelate epimerase n=1 Tax=Rhodanobacter ginsengiterrae TaxID=2008451 RepID=UPI003CEDBF2B